MADLEQARTLGTKIRLPEDAAPSASESLKIEERSAHRDSMLRHGVLISKAMTPDLERNIAEVCERLSVPRSAVSAFVYSSADVQADCLIDSTDSCVLRFTSGLVNLMNEAEFKFVASHELGHFILGHDSCGQFISGNSAEGFMIQRSRELSADRIGYLGIENLDEALRAIIKTASGLTNEHLRFDISMFLFQKELLTKPSLGENKNSTHPSMLIRCRALIWFSMNIKSAGCIEDLSDSSLDDINQRVTRDLERFVDGCVRAERNEVGNDIFLWKLCLLIISEGSFSKDLQRAVSKSVGEVELKQIRGFFDLYGADDLQGETESRLNNALQQSVSVFPSSAPEIEDKAFSRAYSIISSVAGS
jgi:hypothetical protein